MLCLPCLKLTILTNRLTQMVELECDIFHLLFIVDISFFLAIFHLSTYVSEKHETLFFFKFLERRSENTS